MFLMNSVNCRDMTCSSLILKDLSSDFQRNPKIEDRQKKTTHNIGLKICNKLPKNSYSDKKVTTNGKLRWYNQKGLRKKNTNLQKGGTNFKENMYTAQQFAMSEPLSETQGLDNKSNKKPNKQGKSKKDKDK